MIKKVIATAALIVSIAATANNTNKPNPISIQEDADMVRVSVLNTAKETFKVYVYNESGTIIHKSFLGSEVSLGQQFDFSDAPEGQYTFKLITENGKTYSYSVETGA